MYSSSIYHRLRGIGHPMPFHYVYQASDTESHFVERHHPGKTPSAVHSPLTVGCPLFPQADHAPGRNHAAKPYRKYAKRCHATATAAHRFRSPRSSYLAEFKHCTQPLPRCHSAAPSPFCAAFAWRIALSCPELRQTFLPRTIRIVLPCAPGKNTDKRSIPCIFSCCPLLYLPVQLLTFPRWPSRGVKRLEP